MKKRLAVTLVLLLVCLCACSRPAAPPMIHEYTWEMTTVLSKEADGKVVACSPDSADLYEDAKVLVLTCTAADGSFTLMGLSNTQNSTGKYTVINTNAKEAGYEITQGSTTGHAVSGMVTYSDQSQSPTLIFDIGGFVINFMPSPNP